MANSYYAPVASYTDGVISLSSEIEAEFDAIDQAFEDVETAQNQVLRLKNDTESGATYSAPAASAVLGFDSSGVFTGQTPILSAGIYVLYEPEAFAYVGPSYSSIGTIDFVSVTFTHPGSNAVFLQISDDGNPPWTNIAASQRGITRKGTLSGVISDKYWRIGGGSITPIAATKGTLK